MVEGLPIQPRVDRDVTATDPSLVAHGALITSLTSTDSPGTDVAFSRPIVDLAANEPVKPAAEVAFPSKLQNVATYTASDGARQRLTMIPGQFVGEPTTPGTGLQRRFTNVGTRVLYAPISSTDYTAPTFRSVAAVSNGSAVNITADVTDGGGSIVRVLALYRDGAVWRSADLSKVSSANGVDRWVGNGPSVTTSVDLFLQAVDSSGNVAVTSDKATLFQSVGGTQNFAPTVNAGPDLTTPAGTPVVLSGSLIDPDSATWTGTVTSGVSGSLPVPLSIVGQAFAPSLLYTTAGTYTALVQVCDDGNRCSSDTVTVTVTPPAPVITVLADMGSDGLQTVGFQPVRASGSTFANLAIVTGSFANAPAGTATVTVQWSTGGAFVPVSDVSGTSFVATNVYATAGETIATVRVCVGTVCGEDEVTIVTGVSATALTPILECVADRGSTASPRYQARFGYRNTAAFPIYLPTLSNLSTTVLAGVTVRPSHSQALQQLSDNRFAGSPDYRGQTQLFLAGRHENTFQVNFATGNQAWSLNGSLASAAQNSTRCP